MEEMNDHHQQPPSPGVRPIKAKDCIEELLKFTLSSSIDGTLGRDVGLSKYYCSKLLNDDDDPEINPAPNASESTIQLCLKLDTSPREVLDTSTSQEVEKSVHVPTEASPSLVDTSIPEIDESITLEENLPLGTHLPGTTAPMVTDENMLSEDAIPEPNLNGSSSSHMASSPPISFNVHAFSSKVKTFCDKLCMPIQTPVVLNPMDELAALLDPPTSHLKSSFSNEEVQELTEIHQGFAMLDFSSLIEHQLWDQFEICCRALALLKPNSSELTQQLQHGISNIQSDFPYMQDLFQERKALQMVEESMEKLHSQVVFNKNSYKEELLKLQTLRAQEEALLKSLDVVRQQISESTSRLATSEQQAKDQCEAIKLASQQFARSSG